MNWSHHGSLFLVVVLMLGNTSMAMCASNSENSEGPGTQWFRFLPHRPLSPIATFFYDPQADDYFMVYGRAAEPSERTSDNSDDIIFEAISFFKGEVISPFSGSKMKVVFPKRELVQRDGNIVEVKSLDTRISARCPQGVNSYIELRNPDGTILKKKSLLYVPEKSVKMEIDPECASDVNPTFIQSIVTLGSAVISLMGDGSLFVVGPTVDNDAGVLVRLSADLSVPNICESPRFLIVDTEEIIQFYTFEEISYQQLQDQLMEQFRKGRAERCQ